MGPVHTAKALPAPPPHTRHRGALWGHWGPTGVAGTRRLSRPTAARTGQRPSSLPAARRHFRQLFQTLVTSGSPCAAPVWVCAGPARPESGVATQGLACLSGSEAGGAQLGVRSPRAQSRGTALPPAAPLPPLPRDVASGDRIERDPAPATCGSSAAAGGADARTDLRTDARTDARGRGGASRGQQGPPAGPCSARTHAQAAGRADRRDTGPCPGGTESPQHQGSGTPAVATALGTLGPATGTLGRKPQAGSDVL